MEDRSSADSALKQLFGHMSPGRRRQFWLVFALMLAAAAAEVVTIGAVFPFLALISQPEALRGLGWLPGIVPGDPLASAAILLAGAAVVAGAIRLQLAWTTQRFSFGLGHEISLEIQRRVLHQPYSWHVAHSSRDILSSLEKVQMLSSGVALQFVQAVSAGVIALFIVAGLLAIEPVTAALAAGALGLLYFAVSMITRRRLARYSGAVSSSHGERIGIVQESLGGIRDVILDRAQPLYLDAFRRVDRQLTGARAASTFLATAPRFVIESAGIVLIAGAALLLAGREGGFAGALPVLGAFALGAQRLLPLVQQVYHAWSSIGSNRGLTEHILALLRLPMEEDGKDEAAPLPLEREIRLEGLLFSYPGRSEPALAGVDLAFARGSRVAVVGPTGSGKSTLADLVMGLIVPDEGQVTVDGVPLRGERRRGWWRSIAHVPQTIFLADASIARNIAFSTREEEIDHRRVAEAARRAQLAEFVETLPEGYGTRVGERGVRLSGGQRQRLGIARALYKGASVLVLDEATSALDEATEAAVIASLRAVPGLTILMIAHRLHAAFAADMVVRVERGRVSVD
ncbi:MAG TPA: ABC transporter ATP-binding protein [Allosphingosinicella sp.]